MALDDLYPRQDYVIFPGGLKTPGVCEIIGLSSPRKWNVQQGYGLSGATTVYAGTDPIKFKIKVYMWTQLHVLAWEAIARLHLAKALPGLKPIALGISHPMLSFPPISVSSVVIEDVTALEQDEYGGFTVTISCLEWKKPLPALGKPLAAIPAADKAVPSAQDAADVAIQAKVAQLKGLVGG